MYSASFSQKRSNEKNSPHLESRAVGAGTQPGAWWGLAAAAATAASPRCRRYLGGPVGARPSEGRAAPEGKHHSVAAMSAASPAAAAAAAAVALALGWWPWGGGGGGGGGSAVGHRRGRWFGVRTGRGGTRPPPPTPIPPAGTATCPWYCRRRRRDCRAATRWGRLLSPRPLFRSHTGSRCTVRWPAGVGLFILSVSVSCFANNIFMEVPV